MENFLEHQIGYSEYITGNRFSDICNDTGAVFCKTDYVSTFRNSKCKVFVTHNSDYPIESNRYSVGPNADYWFSQNKACEHPNLFSIPIGLENMKLRTHSAAKSGLFSSEIKRANEKALLMDKINSLCFDKNKDVYMNFNINTFPNERNFVWNKFKNESWVSTTKNLPLEKFYMDIATHKFVISPRGNGIDCHRTWEALYLRTIPIVKSSTHMKEFSNLPIFFVDKWEEVCYNTLKDFYKKVKNNLFNLDQMKISHWRNVINEKLSV